MPLFFGTVIECVLTPSALPITNESVNLSYVNKEVRSQFKIAHVLLMSAVVESERRTLSTKLMLD